MTILIKFFQLPYKRTKLMRWINLETIKKSILIEQKYEILIDYNSDDVRAFKQILFIKETAVYILAKHLKSHPEHHNIHIILGLTHDFGKQPEIILSAAVCREYRKKLMIEPSVEEYIYTLSLIELKRMKQITLNKQLELSKQEQKNKELDIELKKLNELLEE